MSSQGDYNRLSNISGTQSMGQSSQKLKSKEKMKEALGVKGNKVELNLQNRTMDEEAEKAFDKILRRPRSRKYVKALKLLDCLSEGDEMIIAEMKKDMGVAENDELTFTPEDIETFKKRIHDILEDEIRQEEEKRRQEEEKRHQEEEKRRQEEEKRRQEEERRRENERPIKGHKLLDTLAPCFIEGCQIHSLKSGEIIHYKPRNISKMGEPYVFSRNLIMEYGGTEKFSFVEIYKHRLAHRNEKGDIIKIYHLNEEGNIES